MSLQSYNSFGIDAHAEIFYSFSSEIELLQALNLAQDKQKLVLGGGSNVLFVNDYDGVVLHNDINGIKVVEETEEHIYVAVGGGENWHRFVLHCVRNKWQGVENLSLIPGSVGASPIQNIGAYGVELQSVFHSLSAIHLATGKSISKTNEECHFGYRDSVFKNELKGTYCITNVMFKLNKKPNFQLSYSGIQNYIDAHFHGETSIQNISNAVVNIRESKLPNPEELGNTGSFFKNPIISKNAFEQLQSIAANVPHYTAPNNQFKIPAAWLIEQCNWKGYREGDAGVYPKHALVLVNYGQATGKDIYSLSVKIIDSVHEKFRITLEREVIVIQ